jgi:predicted Zn-dependent protease with MMP-like domain
MNQAKGTVGATAPDAAEIEEIANRAYRRLPVALRRFIHDVMIRVEDFPDDEVMADMELESPFDLLGLYQGVSLDRQSVSDVREDIDMIFLYRRPLLDYWIETGETLEAVVRHVLIHEIGHHFGLSDDDMDRIEAEG